MNTIDLNEIGKHCYSQLRLSKTIPDKDKSELTLTERKNIINTLQKSILESIKKYDTDIHKYGFMMMFYVSILNYIDNTDLNKYLVLSVKNNE
mgnify:CR=1 FL=1